MSGLPELLKTRRSIRSFKDETIPLRMIEEIVDCARFAPTARNEQPWIFIVTRNKDNLQALADIVSPNGAFLREANACITVFCKDTKYYLEDGASAIVYILLAAWDKGIGSCWIAGDKKPYCEIVRRRLNVSGEYKLIGLVALGYPESIPLKEKKDLKDILFLEEFGRCI